MTMNCATQQTASSHPEPSLEAAPSASRRSRPKPAPALACASTLTFALRSVALRASARDDTRRIRAAREIHPASAGALSP